MSNVTEVRRKSTFTSDESYAPGEIHKPSPKPVQKLDTEGRVEVLAAHFSDAEGAELRRNPSTNDVVRRDTGMGVDIHGTDKTQRQVRDEQQSHFGASGAGSTGHTFLEALHLVTGLGGAAGTIASPFAAGAVGIHELTEAQKNGIAQNEAAVRENAHVAVIGALALPGGYKNERYASGFPDVPRGHNSTADKMTMNLLKDKPGLAIAQLHCDQGIHAAKDLLASGQSRGDFLKANPKIAAALQQDPAFREGFDAYGWATTPTKSGDLPEGGAAFREMEAGLKERDAWHAQAQVSVRV